MGHHIRGAAVSRHEKFETLFADNADLVYRYISRRHRGNNVEDMTSDVFTLAWTKLDEIPQGFELAWLYRTAWNVLANAHRKHIDIPTDLDISGVEPDVADDVLTNDKLLHAWNAVGQRDREVLRLAAWEGLNGRELATVLGTSEGGASAALSRARTHLRQAWDAYEG